MATGAAPALDPKAAESKMDDNGEPSKAKPATLKERVGAVLRTMFEGREEYLGWHQ
ncbi:MAG: hypothetical protein WAL56_06550 [Candidatus Sulfotelmatobacter sp.]